MTQSLYSMIISVFIATVIETAGGVFSIPLMFALFLTIEVLLREKANVEGLRWAASPTTKTWVNVQTLSELKHILFSGSVMMIGIGIVFNPEGQYLFSLTILLTLYGYLEFAHRRNISQKDQLGFERLDRLGIRGTHYILPAWSKIPKELRNQLLAAQYQKIPQNRETHLFIRRGFNKTTVRLVSPGGYRPNEEIISPELLETLEKHPKEEATLALDDQLILVKI